METKICTKCGKEKELKEFDKCKKSKHGVRAICKICRKEYSIENRESINKYQKEFHEMAPWNRTLKNINQRCNNPNNPRYKDYGGKGIKCKITMEELKLLWYRDKAYLLDRPSIDRKENDGNYTFENCRYIEKAENSAKDKRKPVLQFSKDGVFIREWDSVTNANKTLRVEHVSDCCIGFRQFCGGFRWEFKNVS